MHRLLIVVLFAFTLFFSFSSRRLLPRKVLRASFNTQSYVRVRRLDDAVAELKAAVELSPQRPAYYRRLIVGLMDVGKTEEAFEWMDRYGSAFEAGSQKQLDAKLWIADQKRRFDSVMTDQ